MAGRHGFAEFLSRSFMAALRILDIAVSMASESQEVLETHRPPTRQRVTMALDIGMDAFIAVADQRRARVKTNNGATGIRLRQFLQDWEAIGSHPAKVQQNNFCLRINPKDNLQKVAHLGSIMRGFLLAVVGANVDKDNVWLFMVRERNASLKEGKLVAMLSQSAPGKARMRYLTPSFSANWNA